MRYCLQSIEITFTGSVRCSAAVSCGLSIFFCCALLYGRRRVAAVDRIPVFYNSVKLTIVIDPCFDISPAFWTKSRRKVHVPLFLKLLEFLYTTQCRIGEKKPSCRKSAQSVDPFSRTPTCDGQTHRQTHVHRATAYTALA